jgi:hypothetical protein
MVNITKYVSRGSDQKLKMIKKTHKVKIGNLMGDPSYHAATGKHVGRRYSVESIIIVSCVSIGYEGVQ